MIFTKNVVVFFLIFHCTDCLRRCTVENGKTNYYRIKSCYRSTSNVIFWKRVASLDECKTIARDKNGLALNFSPPEAANLTTSALPNCHILGCPEFEESSTLVMDLAFDYYSAYGNLNSSHNATCVKSVGLFKLTETYQNYTQSILLCQNATGDLADIMSEHRTLTLSQIIKDNMNDWYKAAYIGLDDLETKGVFQNSLGKPLTCLKAWAPGHPRSRHRSENCVILDSEGLWRVVKCGRTKLKALCELYPQPPSDIPRVPKNVSCDQISDRHRAKKSKCLYEKELFEIYDSSSRADQCALLNFEEEKKSSESQL